MIIGLDEQQAREALTNAHFSLDHVHFVTALSETVPEGSIIKTNQKAGSIIKSDSDIQATVSKGVGFLIQDYTGMSLTEIEQEFIDQGVHLDVEVEYQGEPDIDPGIIMSQSLIEPGTRIDPDANEKIRFVVSQYPTITIPANLIGMDVEEAKDYLNSEGMAVLTRKTGSGSANKVTGVWPSVGSVYTQEGTDSVITLYY